MTAGTILRTEEGKSVRIEGEMLFRGGEGEIYAADLPGQVAKLYHADKRTGVRERKLRDMIAHAPGIGRLCWPAHLLYDQDMAFMGYLMPRAPERAIAFKLSVLQLGKPSVRERVLPGWNRRDLVRTAKAVADMAAKLHEKDILIGDVNDGNFLVDPGDSSAVYLVDCDSYQFNGYPCPVGTLDYTHPGTAGRLGISGDLKFGEFLRLEPEEDYALSILIFRILALGQYPFFGRGKSTDQAMRERLFPTHIDDSEPTAWFIRKNMPLAIEKAFLGAFRQLEPPSAARWSELLEDYLKLFEDKEKSRNYTLELAPSTFPDYSWKKPGFYRNVVCPGDGTEFNIARDNYETRRFFEGVILCPRCRSFCEAHRRRWSICETMTCTRCGKAFVASDGQSFLRMLDPEVPVYCPDCEEKVEFTCGDCGRTGRMELRILEWYEANNYRVRCEECRKKRYTGRRGRRAHG